MVSIKIERCSSPLPETRNVSAESVSSTRSATLVSTSLNRRSRIFLEVTYFPSLPANGLLLTINSIETVGSSIFTNGSGSAFSGAQTVSPIFKSAIPDTHTISPSAALAVSTRLSPSNWYSFVIFTFLSLPSRQHSTAACPPLTRPRSTLPIPILPIYSS